MNKMYLAAYAAIGAVVLLANPAHAGEKNSSRRR